MDVTGKGTSWQKLTNVSEEHRQKMFDNVKWEFIQEKGLSNGDTPQEEMPSTLFIISEIGRAHV